MLNRLRKLLVRVKDDLQDFIVDEKKGQVIENPHKKQCTDDVIFSQDDQGFNLIDIMLTTVKAVIRDQTYMNSVQFKYANLPQQNVEHVDKRQESVDLAQKIISM